MGDGLAGKVALITGASTPLSLTVARRLGNEGARIAFVGRKVSRDSGIQALLYILVGASFLGAIITWLFRVDTTGVSLEQI